MRRAIDAARQTGDDEIALGAEIGGEFARHAQARGGGVARADDSDGLLFKECTSPCTEMRGGGGSIWLTSVGKSGSHDATIFAPRLRNAFNSASASASECNHRDARPAPLAISGVAARATLGDP